LKVTRRIDNGISTKRKSPRAVEGSSCGGRRKLDNLVIGGFSRHSSFNCLRFPVSKDLDVHTFSLTEFLRAGLRNFSPMRGVFPDSAPDASTRFAMDEVVISPKGKSNLPPFVNLTAD